MYHFNIGEQPNPWDLLQPQDVISRHRGAKRFRRYELSEIISLLHIRLYIIVYIIFLIFSYKIRLFLHPLYNYKGARRSWRDYL